MEVSSIFTNNKNILLFFDEFIYSYPKLLLYHKDEDTAYFKDPETRRSEIYYHFELCDIENEFEVNFSQEDEIFIRNFFKSTSIYMVDISFRSMSKFNNLLSAFKVYLNKQDRNKVSDFILNNPFGGLVVMPVNGEWPVLQGMR